MFTWKKKHKFFFFKDLYNENTSTCSSKIPARWVYQSIKAALIRLFTNQIALK